MNAGIAVLAEKMLGAIQFCPNFIGGCPNLDLVAFHIYEKDLSRI